VHADEIPPLSEIRKMVAITANVRSIVDRDGAVILDIPRNAMTTLDSTGAYVWQRLQRGQQIDSIVAELASETGADEVMIGRDVADFMEQLKARHLVIISGGGDLSGGLQRG
jgi:transcriptional regulator